MSDPQVPLSPDASAQLGNPLRFLSQVLDHANRKRASDIHLRAKSPFCGSTGSCGRWPNSPYCP